MSLQLASHDTICAPATAIGGALGIIRVAGPETFSIVSSICSVQCSRVVANTIHYTHIVDKEGEVIDEAMVSIFRAPHSYTGEDSVELSCHGSSYIIKKVLELLVKNGCRLAFPGEFTQRAFLNGKMDLSQAEAVADLIASTNQATHRLAISQLRGGISSQLAILREQLLKLTSLLELELDFSDHEDLEFANRTELLELANNTENHIVNLSRSFETGQAIKQGIPVAIVGKTNVGKSTLLNRLLHEDRAIVSDIHGTTRDTIEDTIDINGVTFRFIDTAGIRQTTDAIEQIGIQRSLAAIKKARIVLWLIDCNPTLEELQEMQDRCSSKALIVIQNKIDINNNDELSLSKLNPIKISAKYGQGIDKLEQVIYNKADLPTLSETDIIITNARHYTALINAHDNLSRVIEGLEQNISGDLLSEDLRLVLSDLAEITGKGIISSQEVLNNIFSQFCVGK